MSNSFKNLTVSEEVTMRQPNPDFTHLAACPWGNRETKAEVTAKSKGVSNLMLLILRAQ